MVFVRELKAMAKQRGLRGYSRMRKAELIALLDNNQPDDKNKPTVVDNNELKVVPTAAVGKYI